MPSRIGMANRNIITVPCMVNIWLYSSACSMSCSGRASCVRINIARRPPIRKNTPPVIIKRSPILVWLTAASVPQPGRFAQISSSCWRRSRPSRMWLVLIGVLLLVRLSPPEIEILRRVGMHHKLHMRVGTATKLGALAAIGARLIRLQAQHVDMSGNHVELAREARHPEGVNDIGTAQMHVDRHARRNMHDVHQNQGRIGIAHLPPPLMPRDVNTEGVAFVRR